MNVIGSAKQLAGGVGKMLTPRRKSKKEPPPKERRFIHESPEEYADYLRNRRNKGY